MRKVLIVDNDRKLLADLEGLSLISRFPDTTFIYASDPAEADRAIRAEHPDEAVVCADVLMNNPLWNTGIPMRCYAKGQNGAEFAEYAGVPCIGMGRKADEVLKAVQETVPAGYGPSPAGADPRRVAAQRRQFPAGNGQDYASDPRNRISQETQIPRNRADRQFRQGGNQMPLYGQDASWQGNNGMGGAGTGAYDPRLQQMNSGGRMPQDYGNGPFVSFGLPQEEEEVMKVISREIRFYTGPLGAQDNPEKRVPSTVIPPGQDPRTAARSRQLTSCIPSKEIKRIERQGNMQTGIYRPYPAGNGGNMQENDSPAMEGQPAEYPVTDQQDTGKPAKKKKKKKNSRNRKQGARTPAGSPGPDKAYAKEDALPGKASRPDTVLGIGVIVAAFAIVLVIALFGSKVLYINSLVESASMEPTITSGSRIFGSRIAYNNNDVERGDVILFNSEVDYGNIYLKRVIGLPGETVKIKEGGIYIDGSSTPLEEDYLDGVEWTVNNDGYTFTVPEGCYLVLGDNRDESFDSRMWADYAYNNGIASSTEEAEAYAYVPESDIIAEALFIYLPFDEIGFIE